MMVSVALEAHAWLAHFALALADIDRALDDRDDGVGEVPGLEDIRSACREALVLRAAADVVDRAAWGEQLAEFDAFAAEIFARVPFDATDELRACARGLITIEEPKRR